MTKVVVMNDDGARISCGKKMLCHTFLRAPLRLDIGNQVCQLGQMILLALPRLATFVVSWRGRCRFTK